MSLEDDASLDANLPDRQGAVHMISTHFGVLSYARFQHVVLTYDRSSGLARIYLDGLVVAESNLGSFSVDTRYDVHFGQGSPAIDANGAYLFAGVLDEIAFYQRALTSEEILSLAGSRRSGKCRATCSPPAQLQMTSAGTGYLIRWDGVGTLQSAPHVNGPWTHVETTGNAHAVAVSGPEQFFRVVCP
jgi:hypothetical protein